MCARWARRLLNAGPVRGRGLQGLCSPMCGGHDLAGTWGRGGHRPASPGGRQGAAVSTLLRGSRTSSGSWLPQQWWPEVPGPGPGWGSCPGMEWTLPSRAKCGLSHGSCSLAHPASWAGRGRNMLSGQSIGDKASLWSWAVWGALGVRLASCAPGGWWGTTGPPEPASSILGGASRGTWAHPSGDPSVVTVEGQWVEARMC